MQEPYDFNDIRYYFEHVQLPDWFYGKGEKMIKKLGEEGSVFLQRVMELLCKEAGLEMCNIKGQYKVTVCKKCEEYSMMRIDMPELDENHCNYGQHNMDVSETEKRIADIGVVLLVKRKERKCCYT